MFLKPKIAHWFEIYTPRAQTVTALVALARTGHVELQATPQINARLSLNTLQPVLREIDALLAQHRGLLPETAMRSDALTMTPEATAAHAKRFLEDWRAQLESLQARESVLFAEQAQLALLAEYLTAMNGDTEAAARVLHPGELLYKGLYTCPADQSPEGILSGVIEDVVSGPAHRFFVLVGLPEQAQTIHSATGACACRRIEAPAWLPADGRRWPALIAARQVVIADDLAGIHARIESLRALPGLTEALGDVALLKWYDRQAQSLEMGAEFCHVIGWTTDEDAGALQQALDQSGVRAFVRCFEHLQPTHVPTSTTDRWWTRPFALFLDLYGTPEPHEVDPSVILAFVVPLLFGYMFPDVGHGLFLVLLATVLYRRWPSGRFLIPCGLSAMLFGFVFGEIFGYDDVIEPLWIHPLVDPMAVLIVPLIFGVMLIVLGMLLSGLEAYWRGALRRWLAIDAAVPVLYLGVLAAVFYRPALQGVWLALAWYLLGCVLIYRREPRRIPVAAAHLLESAFQLLVNTISFARVGAFALAHAGFSTAIMLLIANIDNPVGYALAFLIGQVFIVGLEGLVVFVQTTRLVLFEFFIRFLRAKGRAFKPLNPPV
jgi:V/A-type H+-transporting ATPase subunit I